MPMELGPREGQRPLTRALTAAVALFCTLGVVALIFFVVLPAVFFVVGVVLLGLAIVLPIAILVRAVTRRSEDWNRPD